MARIGVLAMFLKRINVRKSGKDHVYWALVKSVRTARGPRQQLVSYLGELAPSERPGWAQVGRLLQGRPEPLQTGFLFEELAEPVPDHVEVNVRSTRVEGTRDFGDVYLGLTLWRALGLDRLLEGLIPRGSEEIPWSMMAAILSLARFCEPSSELHVADTWYLRTALEDLLGIPVAKVNDDRLYRTHDHVLPHKEAIERHLRQRFTTLFDAEFDLLLYDVTSTYFEGEMAKNPQARRGYSRDKRFDCKQVCIGLVVNAEGLPVGYEVFSGNRTDVTTVEEIVEAMERKYGRLKRIWVLDRGMVREANLAFIRARGGRYIVGTPRAMLKQFEKRLLEEDWAEVEPGIEVKLCAGPNGEETFVLCRSRERQKKEEGIHARFETRIEEGLTKLANRLARAKKRPDRSQVDRQIGRLLGRNSRAAGLFDIRVKEIKKNGLSGFLKVTWWKRDGWRQWAQRSEGCYLLRTNLTDWDPERLWKTYIQLTQVEAAFRTQKSELRLRPIHHQLEARAQAHILFSFLAYAMWKTLEQWMARSGLGHAPRTIVEELQRIKSHDVVLSTSGDRDVRIRCVTTPDKHQSVLLQRLGLTIPKRLGEPRWDHS